MSTGARIEFEGATVGYGATEVVRDAECEVAPGRVVGLIGPNGAGKSTLIKALTGEADVFGGTVRIAGRDVGGLTPRERASILGVVPQQVSAAFSFPAEEFVAMARYPHLPRFAQPGEGDRRAVADAMRLTDTAHLSGRAVDELSGGDLQRLAFAQALAAGPQALLLDEPVSHLDLNHRLQVLDLTRSLADEGLAVLAVFHELDLATRYADELVVVDSGSTRAAAPPAQVVTAETLREVFGVRAVVGTDPVTGAVAVTPVLRDGAVAESRGKRVLVIGGAGSAAPLMRRLALAGFEVVAGALNAGDADALLAGALGVEFAEIPPFAPMDAAAAVTVAKLADSADAIVVCQVPFGRGNVDNLLVAVRAGRPLVLVGPIEGRDFAGGAAESYWAEALGNGAIQVADADGAFRAIDEMAGEDSTPDS